MDPQQSQKNLGRGRSPWSSSLHFERMFFNNQHSHFSFFIGIFHHLMKGERDNGVAVNSWASQQQVVRRVSNNNIHVTSDFKSPIWYWSLILPIKSVLLTLKPYMVVWVALSQWMGISKYCMTLRGIILNADPRSTWMWLTSDYPIYPV